MKKIPVTFIQEYGGSLRQYFDAGEMRLMIVEHYSDQESWHKHEIGAQIIFVIEGEIEVHSIVNNTKEIGIITANEFVMIPTDEWHKVSPRTERTKLIVIKYLPQNIKVSQLLRDDYVRMEK